VPRSQKKKEVSGFIKEFELVPGDRIRLTLPASEPFPAGWAKGTVLTAKHYGERDGWFIELEKDEVSPGWQRGYGYWKQGVDGGTVEKLDKESSKIKTNYYYCDNTHLHSNNEVIQIKTEEENPRCPYCGGVMTYGRYWGPLIATQL